MFKFLPILLISGLCLLFLFALPAAASFCRQINNHLICIASIHRSAKYHWEYRAAVKIDGVARPIELYNCRQRVRVRKDGQVVPFEPNGAGELICSTLKG
ncbi:MAG TPA: hypothetical protein IGS52_22190 [Oscillatoriaceae cyanobacterium M33_DOE_052]|uniref:Uncharacterized protein n=1 Tax=Planktothricoides sp. SpSt-374 TaxID=2282167 RepID=A0A7C3ZN19_9CYAN|nr:hypothetical protein [Oscillatoriaceae cyanobacterium M33_DOE_052]